MFHRHLHIAPVDYSPLALVLQLIPKYSQIAINRTFLKMNVELVELELLRRD